MLYVYPNKKKMENGREILLLCTSIIERYIVETKDYYSLHAGQVISPDEGAN